MARIRIYGKELQSWTATDENGREKTTQVEYSYTEYNENGEKVGTGSEDFSLERLRTEILDGRVFTWDGERRNKGGYRWFTDEGFYRIRRSDRKEFTELMKNRYSATMVQYRTF